MDPIQIEAQLRNTFLAILGGDMSLYEGTKQQYIMRFNSESRNLANGMIAQAQQRNPAVITQQDYQAVSMDLLNRYKASMPQQQAYAAPMASPMYPQPMYGAPAPMAPQPGYGIPIQQPMYRPAMPFSNLQYTPRPQMYAPVVQQPMYQPIQPTVQPLGTDGKSLYDGALPSNASKQQQMVAPVVQQPPMAGVAKATAPITLAEPQFIQPTVATYSIPQITGRHMFADKTPQPIKGEVVTYQKENGEQFNAVNASTSAMISDVDAIVKALAKKKNAVDVTLRYTPYILISGDLSNMQQSFIDVKKIIADCRRDANVVPSSIIEKIVEYCDNKTKGIAKQIESIILGIYNSYVKVANNIPDTTTVVPDASDLECLQMPGSASAEKYIGMALSEFEQYSIYDPSSSQVAAWLKDIDIMIDSSFADLKKNKEEFSKWAKSHCIIKKPVEFYRYTTVNHEATDISQGFGYVSSTPPDDALEFLTMEAISKDPARVVTMVTKEGKSFITSVGTIDRSNGMTHIEFE